MLFEFDPVERISEWTFHRLIKIQLHSTNKFEVLRKYEQTWKTSLCVIRTWTLLQCSQIKLQLKVLAHKVVLILIRLKALFYGTLIGLLYRDHLSTPSALSHITHKYTHSHSPICLLTQRHPWKLLNRGFNKLVYFIMSEFELEDIAIILILYWFIGFINCKIDHH